MITPKENSLLRSLFLASIFLITSHAYSREAEEFVFSADHKGATELLLVGHYSGSSKRDGNLVRYFTKASQNKVDEAGSIYYSDSSEIFLQLKAEDPSAD